MFSLNMGPKFKMYSGGGGIKLERESRQGRKDLKGGEKEQCSHVT